MCEPTLEICPFSNLISQQKSYHVPCQALCWMLKTEQWLMCFPQGAHWLVSPAQTQNREPRGAQQWPFAQTQGVLEATSIGSGLGKSKFIS